MLDRVRSSLRAFVKWLDTFGEYSQDHQDFFNSTIGRRAKSMYYRQPKLGTMAVAPMVLCEAFLPATRRFFYPRQRLPIADAHYAMAFAYLFETFGDNKLYAKALHFLEVLKQTRCPAFREYCWGYPFDWETRTGTIPSGTPLITTTPYAYEAFSSLYNLDQNPEWLEIMRSIAAHAANDIKDFPAGPGAATCSYTPFDKGGVINASAYRSFLLTRASEDFGNEHYREIAARNLTFVIQNQQPDGSWIYAVDQVRDFIDHFHTCFVLKALVKIERITKDRACTAAIDAGIRYYLNSLFDEKGLPKPFARAPRLTVYRNELYDYAECINLLVLVKDSYAETAATLENVVDDLLQRWQKPDGSFRSRRLLFGWDNVPMHRWGMSQVVRSLSFLLHNFGTHPTSDIREIAA